MVKQSFAPDDYFKALKLTQDPFQAGFSETTFFTTTELQHRLDLAKHLLEYGQQILLVKGAQGVGKTAFTRQLMVKAESEWIVCRIEASAAVDPDTLIKAISHEHLDEMEDSPDTIVTLNRYLEFCNQNQKIPVLFIDEADKLNQGCLRFIFQLMDFREQGTFIRIVLIADDPFLKRLNGVAEEFSNSGLVHTISIPAFNLEETGAYLRHRISACGGREDMFSEKELSRIYKVSGGLAGNINFLARQGLSDPAALDAAIPASNILEKSNDAIWQLGKLVLASLLLTVVIFTLWSFSQEESVIKTHTIPVNLPPQPRVKLKDDIPVVKLSSSQALPDTWLDTQRVAETILDSSDRAAEVHSEVKAKSTDFKNVEKQKQERPVPAPTLPTVVAHSKLQAQVTPPTGSTESGIYKIRGKSWLLAQPGDHYVLQLIGAMEMETIMHFLDQGQVNRQQLALYKTLKSGKDWHVLVYGLYGDRELARAAISTLSTKAQAEKPWPKSIKAIQEAIESPQLN